MSRLWRKRFFFGMLFILVVTQFSLLGMAQEKPEAMTFYNFGRQTDRYGRAWEMPNKNGAMTQWIKNEFGLDFTYEYVLDAYKQDQMTLWSASGDYPETFVYITHAAVYNWGRNIKWHDLSEYYDDPVNFPNLYRIKHEHSRTLQPLIFDGEITGFPIGINFKVGEPNPDTAYTGGWYIRQDILEALGDERPTTLDEFTEMLRKIKAGDFKAPDGKPVIPLLLPPSDWYSQCIFFQTFGLNWIGLAKEGWYQFWGLTQQGYEAMKYANQLYNEGLIDPEWVTQGEEMFQEKQRNGSAAVMVGWIGYDVVESLQRAGHDLTYTALPVPKIPGISRPFPWNPLPGPDADFVLYVTDKASDEQVRRLARLIEWTLTPEGARSLYLGASPDMIELKTSGPYEGSYWFKDEYQDLDWYVYGDTTAARIKHGVLPLNGPVSYTREELQVPAILGPADQWARDNYEWITANNNVTYLGDVGPEYVPDEVVSINNQIWSMIPARIHRAVILSPQQFEREYQRIVEECKRIGAKELFDDQWARRKKYIEDNGGKEALGIPEDYPYADLLLD